MSDARFCFGLSGALVPTPLQVMVAAAADLVEEVEVLARATDRGEIPWDRSVRLQCRLLASVPISEARRRIAVAPFDRDIAEVLASHRDRSYLVSTLPTVWLDGLHERLGGTLIASEAKLDGDRLGELVEVVDMRRVVERLHQDCETVFAVGSGISDVDILEAADVAIAYGQAVPPAVRDACDYWVTSGRGLWQLLKPL